MWTSPDLRGSFARIGNLSEGQAGVPSGFFHAESGQYWTYGHSRQGDVVVIKHAIHTELDRTLPADEWSVVVSASALGLSLTRDTGSPGFAVNE